MEIVIIVIYSLYILNIIIFSFIRKIKKFLKQISLDFLQTISTIFFSMMYLAN